MELSTFSEREHYKPKHQLLLPHPSLLEACNGVVKTELVDHEPVILVAYRTDFNIYDSLIYIKFLIMSVEGHVETCHDLEKSASHDEASSVRTDDWAHIVLRNLKHRNKVQVEPFSAIYQSNTKLWYEHARLQSLLKDTKHQFASVQHESSELFKTLGTDSSATAVDKLKLKLAQIQIDLREKGNLESNESKIKIDLSKKVRDQGKLIADQSEELKIAKGELSAAHEMMTFLTEETRTVKNSAIAAKDEVDNLRKQVSNLEKENSNLIERILIEKSKTAQAMNDMMNSAVGS